MKDSMEYTYKRTVYRSKAEAMWAMIFDRCGVTFRYEETKATVGGVSYIPDFRIVVDGGASDFFVEYKGQNRFSPEAADKARRFAEDRDIIVIYGSVPKSIGEYVNEYSRNHMVNSSYFIANGRTSRPVIPLLDEGVPRLIDAYDLMQMEQYRAARTTVDAAFEWAWNEMYGEAAKKKKWREEAGARIKATRTFLDISGPCFLRIFVKNMKIEEAAGEMGAIERGVANENFDETIVKILEWIDNLELKGVVTNG